MAATKPDSSVRCSWRVLTIILFGCGCINAFVQELDDRFRNLKQEGSWFVEFYAPWCGYCQKLEPIWAEVGRTLQGSSVQVAKLDATRFSDIAREFGVRGYPSIKFIKGKRVITYEGERAVQDLVQFAEKASRPAVTELKDSAQMQRVVKEKSVCFFLITGADSPELSKNLKVMYSQVAEDRVVQSYFYQIDFNAIPRDIEIQAPAIVVSKDDTFYTYQVPEDVSEQNISDWVDNERFEAFIHVTRSNFHDIAETGKVMMLAIFAEKKSKKKDNERLRKVVEAVSLKEREKFHRHFQFGWMLGDTIAANIMMSSLTAPFLIAYNTTDHVYYLKYYSEVKDDFTQQQLVSFLEDILQGRAKGYGGDSYVQRVYRGIWDLLRTIYDIWATQPIAALLMFGFPLLVFSFVIYMLCIADPGNEDEDLEDLEDLDEFNDEGVDLPDHINEEKEIDESEEAVNSAKPKTD